MRVVRLGGFRKPIGKQGEHGVTRVEIDVSELIRDLPGGMPIIMFERGDGLKYPVETHMDGSIVWFVPELTETYVAGNNSVEVYWHVTNDLGKSVTYAVDIKKSSNSTESPDIPGETWVAQIANMVQTISAKVDEAVPEGGDEGQVLTKHDGANIWADPQGGGTGDHRELTNRDADNQHPINAIEGLRAELDGKQGTINDLSIIREGAGKGETAIQPDDLAPVATSGSYNDLDDTPSIPESLADLSEDSTHQTVTAAQKSGWDAKADPEDIPDALADLVQDANHRTVTDAEKAAWSAKQPAGDYALESELAAEIEARQEAEADLQEQINEKQNTISDLETIRSGAASGATAYQKPTGGIPKSDLTSNVQSVIDNALTEMPSADEIEYDPNAQHTAGSVGAELSSQSSSIVIISGGAVRADVEQEWTDDQKVLACQNIGAVYGGHINTYDQILRVVRAGNAATYFPIGTQISVENTTIGDVLFDVVSHSKIIHPITGQQVPAMWIFQHYTIYGRQFDAQEAFYYAETALPAGTYNFTLATAYSSWAAGTYQFTLSSQLPAGGQLCISGYADAAMTSRKVDVYASQVTTTKTESCTITSGNAGTSLGTFGVELNHPQRVSYGSNNYAESAIRQWINSNAGANGWWMPTNKYDHPPSYANVAGFLNGMDEEFLAIISAMDVPCKTNNTFELQNWTKNTAYTVRDKFFLASRDNIGFGMENVAEGNAWEAYVNAEATDRIKYDFDAHSTARNWFVRSPYPGDARTVRIVASGALDNGGAVNGFGAAAACVIF